MLVAPPKKVSATRDGLPGATGLNVTSPPSWSTAAHWLADGQAMAVSRKLGSTVAGCGVPGDAGLKVTSWPLLSTAVHWLVDGQATARRVWVPVWSSAIGEDQLNESAEATGARTSSASAVTAPPIARRANCLDPAGPARKVLPPRSESTRDDSGAFRSPEGPLDA